MPNLAHLKNQPFERDTGDRFGGDWLMERRTTTTVRAIRA
jgi:hypothetical protein